MNRLAVVLAADSATTVTRWVNGKEEERYFKGANKIHQLSNDRPVGIMVFDSADLLKVPWELIVKEFRSQLGSKSFNDIRSYADEFFKFVRENNWLFPSALRAANVTEAARTAAVFILADYKNIDEGERPALDTFIESKHEELTAQECAIAPDAEWVARVILPLRAQMTEVVEPLPAMLGLDNPLNWDRLIDSALLNVALQPERFFGSTGIVVAGFGDHDVFPSMVEYVSHGLVMDAAVVREQSAVVVNHETPAWLSAFAQTDMSDTFSLGLSQDVYSSLMSAVNDVLEVFGTDVARAANVTKADIENFDIRKRVAAQVVSDRVLNDARKKHAIPLRQVLSVLPYDEMAELAETLINLQALKEKVTKPSETVGGPVDVAVITRSEGLVWIKRKHFFDPALNSRYMQRQSRPVR